MATFTLSILDQAAPCSYHRYATTFACNENEITATIERLQRAVKGVINEIPMLAGTVSTDHHRKLVVSVTLQQVESFSAAISRLENSSESYSTICGGGIPPRHISGEDFTPLYDDADIEGSPACAIQGNFIDGGLILVIYLHHGVADIRGVNTILRLMSEGMPLRRMDEETLGMEAKAVSAARARLSDGNGAPPFLALARDIQRQQQQNRQQGEAIEANTEGPVRSAPRSAWSNDNAAVFSFKLAVVSQTAEIINSRRSLRTSTNNFPVAEQVTRQDVLVAIIWCAFARANWPSGNHCEGVETTISFPVDLRSYMIPPLEAYWMGNAETIAVARRSALDLSMRYDVSTLEGTASTIRAQAKAAASDLLVRSRINLLNTDPHSGELPTTDLVIHDWTPLSELQGQELDLGLGIGLGRPNAIRRTGRAVGRNEVILLPENETEGVWEVQMELQPNIINAMINDESLQPFLWHVAQ